MNGGFVNLYRSIQQWEWYTDNNTKALFLHCLINANYKRNRWKGVDIEVGSFVTSTEKLAAELGLTRQNVRTSLTKLKSTNEITTKSTNKYIVITIVKWGDYQSLEERTNQQINTQLTVNQPTTNQQLTTTNKENKENKEKKKDKDEHITPTKSSFGEFGKVKLTQEEHAKIVADGLTDYIARVDAYKASTGKRYSSDYATIRNWARKDGIGKRIEPIPDYTPPKTETVDIDTLKERLAQLGKRT